MVRMKCCSARGVERLDEQEGGESPQNPLNSGLGIIVICPESVDSAMIITVDSGCRRLSTNVSHDEG